MSSSGREGKQLVTILNRASAYLIYAHAITVKRYVWAAADKQVTFPTLVKTP